jgi:hypothetical protein
MVIFVDVARVFENDRYVEYRFDSNRGSGWLLHDKALNQTELRDHRAAAAGSNASSKGFQ